MGIKSEDEITTLFSIGIKKPPLIQTAAFYNLLCLDSEEGP